MAGSKKGRRTRLTLTAVQEREIVRGYYKSRWRYGRITELADQFKVSRQTVHNVLKRCEYNKKADEVSRVDLSSLAFDG